MLVDDHEVVRLGLRTLLRRKRNLEIVAEAGTMAHAVSQAAKVNPDVVLMDMRLPDGTGLEACREIRSANPSAKVLFLTSYSDEEAVVATILAGAAGYLLKEIGHQALLGSIERVAAGESILDAKVTADVASYLRKVIGQPALLGAFERVAAGKSILDANMTGMVVKQVGLLANAANHKRGDGHDNLSEQEGRILALVVEGKTNKEIAADLNLSAKTVKNYLSNAFHKLRVGRRAHAAAAYSRLRGRSGSE